MILPTLSFNEHNPHQVLGLHEEKGYRVIRLYRPDAQEVFLEVKGKIVKAEKKTPDGLFEYGLNQKITAVDYRVYHKKDQLFHDPYAFMEIIGEVDAHLFHKGVHYRLYEVLGANFCEHFGILGIKFAVWAPNAKAVYLIADFNDWDQRINPMRSVGNSGVFELFVPGITEGEKYKFVIKTKDSETLIKADPHAFYAELRPKTASIVANPNNYKFKDTHWLQNRPRYQAVDKPLLIYEVHLGSWKRDNSQFKNYKELAHELAAYVKEMGFTHVELMPVMEHPLDESWGYQVTGFYAVTSRFGTLQDFQYFVDFMHQNNIGVIIDWVPAHFPIDDHALKLFDGTHLYEHQDPKKGFHPHWNTLIFNYARREVSNFLIASALYWIDKLHIDGIRVDAVASMLYLDYGREEGEWIPNVYGGKENLEAIEFLKHLNAVIHDRFPGVLVFAEESSTFPHITGPLHQNGIGFDYKWNMGWMNDTLSFFAKDCIYRSHHHSQLTFGLLYAFSEKYALPLSHDEVVHGKASLLSKMPGDDWQKFANLRLLYSYQICQPGKKLLFMGAEIAQRKEWDVKSSLEWYLLEYAPHRGIQLLVKELNSLYKLQKPLWEKDSEAQGFEWIDFNDVQNSVIAYLRKTEGHHLAIVHNFTPSTFEEYFIRLPHILKATEIFNTDAERFGGTNVINLITHVDTSFQSKSQGFKIRLPPLATVIFEVHFA